MSTFNHDHGNADQHCTIKIALLYLISPSQADFDTPEFQGSYPGFKHRSRLAGHTPRSPCESEHNYSKLINLSWQLLSGDPPAIELKVSRL